MTKFDIQSATSYATAAAVALVSTVLIFGAVNAPVIALATPAFA